MRFLETERALDSGRLDIVFQMADGSLLVVELKKAKVTPSTVQQVSRYVRDLQALEPNRQVTAMVAAPAISEAGRHEAEQRGVLVRVIDLRALEAEAAKQGLPVAHGSGHRPQLRGSAAGSRNASPVTPRKGTPPEIVEHLRTLHEQYPPGTLDAKTPLDTLKAYWGQACLRGTPRSIEQVALFTAEVLRLVPGSAVGPRSQSRQAGWTTVRVSDGRVVASFDARGSRAALSFYAVQDDVERLDAAQGARLKGPRGYSFWFDCFVGPAGLTFEEAMELLRRGTRFEFDLTGPPQHR
ncbi:MAG: Endonuclease NucS [Frankiales bacterium]|nr:Endonuclease NucS [Frankiales bacterium]